MTPHKVKNDLTCLITNGWALLHCPTAIKLAKIDANRFSSAIHIQVLKLFSQSFISRLGVTRYLRL